MSNDTTRCTCPSGDGSLRWPCPAHPPEAQAQNIGPEWKPCRKRPVIVHVREQRPGEQHVSTREGITAVKPDDLIMRGVEGEEYPIGRELFAKTYDLVSEAQGQGGGEFDKVIEDALRRGTGMLWVEHVPQAGPGEDPKPPHTPALRWLADREAVATQEWQDGFNAAYSYYAQQPAAVDGAMVERACRAHDRMYDHVGSDTRADMRERMYAALTAALAQQPAAVDESLPDFLDRIAGELVSRDTRAGTFAPGIAESLRGRAIVLRTLAAQPGGSDNGR